MTEKKTPYRPSQFQFFADDELSSFYLYIMGTHCVYDSTLEVLPFWCR